ncbi:MAG: sterol desaturase family protein [Myxococcales bacterium]|nr:sterol desaturase family protein [Myxococcales bacterium]
MIDAIQSPWFYPVALAALSLVIAVVEWGFKLRTEQPLLRPGLWSDLLHLVFNGHFLGVIMYGIATRHLLPHIDGWLSAMGLTESVYRQVAVGWPAILQIVVALFAIDFMQWCVHNLLHRVPLLWEFHKTHHSVVDGEMDWIVSFRFQWTEVVVYRFVLFLPLAWFGFGMEAILFHAIFGTLIGHLNHANLAWDYGRFRYLLNSPRMHLWHHDYEGDDKSTVNFGIIFSLWDWIFGTAKIPTTPPKRLGFPGVEAFPSHFFGHTAWPLTRLVSTHGARPTINVLLGLLIIAIGYGLALP